MIWFIVIVVVFWLECCTNLDSVMCEGENLSNSCQLFCNSSWKKISAQSWKRWLAIKRRRLVKKFRSSSRSGYITFRTLPKRVVIDDHWHVRQCTTDQITVRPAFILFFVYSFLVFCCCCCSTFLFKKKTLLCYQGLFTSILSSLDSRKGVAERSLLYSGIQSVIAHSLQVGLHTRSNPFSMSTRMQMSIINEE